MILTNLKSYRLARGYSLRELARRSGVDFTTIDRLERLHKNAQERTAYKLAEALRVDLLALVAVEQPEPTLTKESIQTPTLSLKPARSTRAKKQPPAGNCWVIDHEGDAFGPFVQAEAERLKGKLGQARVYEAESKNEARELHRAFLIRVVRGHDTW